jgi:hypothetical protein
MLLDSAPQPRRSYALAKKTKKTVRREWTAADFRTPVVKISKEMKRTVGALRQKAIVLGIGLGHQR